MISARPSGKRTRLVKIFRSLYKRQREPFDAEVQHEFEILPIFRGQRRKGKHDIGHIHALPFRQRTAHHDFGLGKIAAAARDPQAQLAVIQQ